MLPRYGLITFTWGNVSGIDRERGLVVIKPSGVAYENMLVEDMVVVDLDGNRVEGCRRQLSIPTANGQHPLPKPDSEFPLRAPHRETISMVKYPAPGK